MRFLLLVVAIAAVGIGAWAITAYPESVLGVVAVVVSILGVLATLYFRSETLKVTRDAHQGRSDQVRVKATFDCFARIDQDVYRRVGRDDDSFERFPGDHRDVDCWEIVSALDLLALQIQVGHVDETLLYRRYHGGLIYLIEKLRPTYKYDDESPNAFDLADAWSQDPPRSLATGKELKLPGRMRSGG